MKKQIVNWIIGVVVLLIIIGVWYFIGGKKTSTPTPTATPTTTPTGSVAASPTATPNPIEVYFNKATDPAIQGAKAKTVDAELRPILATVFNKVVDDKTVVGVKLQEEFGPMLTYAFNRVVTAADMSAVQKALEGLGFKMIDSSAKIITMSQIGKTWVMTFGIDNQQKATLDVTF